MYVLIKKRRWNYIEYVFMKWLSLVPVAVYKRESRCSARSSRTIILYGDM